MENNIKFDYIKSFSVVINDIETVYSDNNKSIYKQVVKDYLLHIANNLNDNDYLKTFIYDISEIFYNTNTVLLTLNDFYDGKTDITNKQIIV